MVVITAALCGLIFGAGLLIAGVTDPIRVLAFLDPAGAWDASMLLVLVGATAVSVPAFALATRRRSSLNGAPMVLPTARRIDRRLVLGSLAFGIGWGLSGACPGAVIVSLGSGRLEAVAFVAAMLAGMGLSD